MRLEEYLFKQTLENIRFWRGDEDHGQLIDTAQRSLDRCWNARKIDSRPVHSWTLVNCNWGYYEVYWSEQLAVSEPEDNFFELVETSPQLMVVDFL